MTYSYGGNPWNAATNPTGSKVDTVRLDIGDTDSTDWLLTDEEIEHFVAGHPMPFASAAAAEAIAARFARQVTKQVGKLRLQASDKHRQYMALAETLRRRALTDGIGPWAGGQSVADKTLQEQDVDRVQPSFNRNLHDYPGDSLPTPDSTRYDVM